jgi:hypothetical protein
MEKSIESIWKEGFLDNNALLAPKLNDLYTRKSIHFIDKFTRLFKINLIAIAVFAGVLLVASFVAGIPFVGGFLFLLFMSLAVVGKPEMDKLKKIDKNQNSFQYLSEFDRWLKGTIQLYTKIYKVFYPLFFLGLAAAIWASGLGSVLLELVTKIIPDMYLYRGIPAVWLVTMLMITNLLYRFGGTIYQLDMKLTYGNALRKLDEMLADMEELRS